MNVHLYFLFGSDEKTNCNSEFFILNFTFRSHLIHRKRSPFPSRGRLLEVW